MQVILGGPLNVPDIALVPIAAPVAFHALRPAIEDRLVLALVIGAAEGEAVLRPDDEGRPMAACGLECRL